MSLECYAYKLGLVLPYQKIPPQYFGAVYGMFRCTLHLCIECTAPKCEGSFNMV